VPANQSTVMTPESPQHDGAGVLYRSADLADVEQLAQIRAAEWGTLPYWRTRIRGYMIGELSPHQAQSARTVVVAIRTDVIVGFAAAHLTSRLGCNGELEWLNVEPRSRRLGIANQLLRLVAAWFVGQQATYVCVDSDEASRSFYERQGARPLGKHWLAWPDVGVLLNDVSHQTSAPRSRPVA
jgi:GNAT superfamily N-acetyltransferase